MERRDKHSSKKMEVKEEKNELIEEVENLPEPAEHTHIFWVIAVAVLVSKYQKTKT